MSETVQPAPPPPPKKKHPLGCFLKSALGCFALLAGLVLTAFLLLPSLLGRFAGGWIEDGFAEMFQGRLEVGEVDFAWSERQTLSGLRLLDPAGAPVLSATATLPSLGDLLKSGGRRLGRIEIEVSGDLAADDAGATNLERALAPREPEEPERDRGGDSDDEDWRENVRELDLELALRAPRLTWSDARTRAIGAPIVLQDLQVDAVLAQGERAELQLAGQLVADTARPLAFSAVVERPLALPSSPEPPRAQVTANLERLPTGLIDAVAGLSGKLVRAIGPDLTVKIEGSGTTDAGEFVADLGGERLDAHFAGRIENGVLRGSEQRVLRVELRADPAFYAELLGPGAPLERLGDDALTLTVDELEFPIARVLEGQSPLAALEHTRAKAELTVGRLRIVPLELQLVGNMQLAIAPAEEGTHATFLLSSPITSEPGRSELLKVELGADIANGIVRAQGSAEVRGAERTALVVQAGADPLQALLASGFLVEVRKLVFPLDSKDAPLASTIESDIRVDLGDVTWQGATPEARLELTGASLSLSTTPADRKLPAIAELKAVMGPDSPLTARVELVDALELLEFRERPRLSGATITARAPALDAARLDALAGGGPLGATLGARLALALDAHASWKEKGPLAFDLALDVRGDKNASKLTATGEVRDPMGALERGELPEANAKLDLSGAQAWLALVPEEWRTAAAELVGPDVHGSLAHRPVAADTRALSLALETGATKLALGAAIQANVLRMGKDEKLELVLPVHRSLVDTLIGGRMPPGASLAPLEAGAPLRLYVSGVELSLAPWVGAEPRPALAVAVDQAHALVNLALPDLLFVQAPAAAGEAGIRAEISHVTIGSVALEPGKLTGAKLTGQIESAQPGSIEMRMHGEHPAGLLPGAPPEMQPVLHFDGQLEALPTALVDALAGQDGLLVDVLGPELELKLSGAWPSATGEPLKAELQSAKASVKLQAALEDGVVESQGEQGIDASLGLTPLFGERILGNLVPLLVDLRQPPEAKRAMLSARNFRLPLSGNLRELSGQIDLDLGEIQYRFLPGLDELVGKETSEMLKSVALKPMSIAIEQGVARYDNLALPLGKKELLFRGTFDIVDKSYKLKTDVPLRMLGKSVARELEKFSEYLDPETLVPIEIRGTQGLPKLRIADEFLKQVVEEAGRNAIEKGLQDLLGDKKKNKKDG